jgi:hypothetical protein
MGGLNLSSDPIVSLTLFWYLHVSTYMLWLHYQLDLIISHMDISCNLEIHLSTCKFFHYFLTTKSSRLLMSNGLDRSSNRTYFLSQIDIRSNQPCNKQFNFRFTHTYQRKLKIHYWITSCCEHPFDLIPSSFKHLASKRIYNQLDI